MSWCQVATPPLAVRVRAGVKCLEWSKIEPESPIKRSLWQLSWVKRTSTCQHTWIKSDRLSRSPRSRETCSRSIWFETQPMIKEIIWRTSWRLARINHNLVSARKIVTRGEEAACLMIQVCTSTKVIYRSWSEVIALEKLRQLNRFSINKFWDLSKKQWPWLKNLTMISNEKWINSIFEVKIAFQYQNDE